ncbi:MAG: TetR/AcrR family transcriptional regulator [Lachnospiraceae bacterium]|nr:TetR/AcrR family transcriptional regulator [Lachnospiraceae bacterium]
MGEKSELKREYILKKAKVVFAHKGYRAVTMKDIVEACEISRGGLYLYFGSTEDIFKEILKLELESGSEEGSGNLSQDASMTEILMFFLKEQKKMILRKKQDITIATYEYMFAHRGEKDSTEMIRTQFETGVMVLTKIIQEGVERGEFYCANAKAEANNIMYVLEGMKVCAKTLGLSERKVDEELLYLVSGLVMEE